MDRPIVYTGELPRSTDFLTAQQNTMIAIGNALQAVFGNSTTIVTGLTVAPTSPASMSIQVGPGSIIANEPMEPNAYGSLASDTSDSLVKMGINATGVTSLALTAPGTTGQSINYLIEAAFLEADGGSTVLSYFNSSNPAQAYAGPSNTGTSQNTVRTQSVALQAKAGTAATTGTQTTPSADSGYVPLAVVTVAYGATTIVSGNISVHPLAPYPRFNLQSLGQGFGAGVQSFTSSGNFTVPNGVTQVEVEVWGAGSGSYASTASIASGGGSGGGYARKRITGLTAGSVIAVTVGAGGTAGSTSGPTAPTAGGTSSFGSYVSATGGSLNPLANTGAPALGGTPSGAGTGGDVNVAGGDGSNGGGGSGGYGATGANGGGARAVASSIGNAGYFPGGGASGAGTGSGANNGAAGAGGLVVVRW